MATGDTAEQEAGFRALLSGAVPEVLIFDPVTEADSSRGGWGCGMGCVMPVLILLAGFTPLAAYLGRVPQLTPLAYSLLAICILIGFFFSGWFSKNEFYALDFKLHKLQLKLNSSGNVTVQKSWPFGDMHKFALDLPAVIEKNGQNKSALYLIFKNGKQVQLLEATYTTEFLNSLIAKLEEALGLGLLPNGEPR